MIVFLSSLSIGVQVVGQWTGICRPAFEGRCEKQLCLEPAALCNLQHYRLWRSSSSRQRSPVSNIIHAHIKHSSLRKNKSILRQSLWACLSWAHCHRQQIVLVHKQTCSVPLTCWVSTEASYAYPRQAFSWVCLPALLFIVQTKLLAFLSQWAIVEQPARKSVSLEPHKMCCTLVFCILFLEGLEGEAFSV